MNYLSIDYGSKRVGLAYSINGIICTLPQVANNQNLISHLEKIITDYSISKIYIGMSEGLFAQKTKLFVDHLTTMLKLPIETVNEAVSTIEADEIFKSNQYKTKKYRSSIDSLAAAVILRRVIN